MMKHQIRIRKSLALAVILWLGAALPGAWAINCPGCSQKDLPELLMACPGCGANLHTSESLVKARSNAALVVEILYTGDKPDKLPEYGKIFINRKYRGNIPLVEKEPREKILLESGRTGLGFDFTGVYRSEFRGLDSGLYNIHVEMVFRSLGGLYKDHRRVEFRRISLNPEEKTVIRHSFTGPGDFSKKKKPAEPKKGRPTTQFLDGIYLKKATGTLSLEIPLID